MAVKIRLQRKGRKKFPFYHIVIADSRSPRDGKFIENIGVYNPMTKPATIELDRDKAYDWMTKGAQPTETVRAILRFKGVLFKKHLMDGVAKGAHTEEQAMAKYNAWLEEKESKIRKRREHSESEKEAFRKAVSGTVPKIVIREDTPAAEAEETVVAEAPEEVAATEVTEAVSAEAPAVEETPAPVVEIPEVKEEPAPVVEAPATEEVPAPVVEAQAAEVTAEAPKAEDTPVIQESPAEEEKKPADEA